MSKIAGKTLRVLSSNGGKENIASVSHCLTRLRFVLNDTEQANKAELEKLKLAKGCFTNAGQFQVVIGTEVDEVYALLIEQNRQKMHHQKMRRNWRLVRI